MRCTLRFWGCLVRRIPTSSYDTFCWYGNIFAWALQGNWDELSAVGRQGYRDEAPTRNDDQIMRTKWKCTPHLGCLKIIHSCLGLLGSKSIGHKWACPVLSEKPRRAMGELKVLANLNLL